MDLLIFSEKVLIDFPFELGQEVVSRSDHITTIDLGDCTDLNDDQREYLSDPDNVRGWALRRDLEGCFNREVLRAKVCATFAKSKNVQLFASVGEAVNG